MNAADLTRYLDAAETTSNTTLCRAAAWDNHTSPMSEPLPALLECMDLLGHPVRRMLISPAALRAVLTHPTVQGRARALGSDPQALDARWLEARLRLHRCAIEEDEALAEHVLLFGASEDERYAIFYALAAPPAWSPA